MKNNDLYREEVLKDIFAYHQCISICVYQKEHFYILCQKDYFELDAKRYFLSCLERRFITQAQYKKYRGGIWQLTKENFEQFLQPEEVRQLD